MCSKRYVNIQFCFLSYFFGFFFFFFLEQVKLVLSVPRSEKVDMLNIQAVGTCKSLLSLSLWEKEGVLDVADKLIQFGATYGVVPAKKLLSTGPTVSKAIGYMDEIHTKNIWGEILIPKWKSLEICLTYDAGEDKLSKSKTNNTKNTQTFENTQKIENAKACQKFFFFFFFFFF